MFRPRLHRGCLLKPCSSSTRPLALEHAVALGFLAWPLRGPRRGCDQQHAQRTRRAWREPAAAAAARLRFMDGPGFWW